MLQFFLLSMTFHVLDIKCAVLKQATEILDYRQVIVMFTAKPVLKVIPRCSQALQDANVLRFG